MNLKKFLLVFLSLTLALFCGTAVSADSDLPRELTDNNVKTRLTVNNPIQIYDTNAKYIYITFYNKPVDFILGNDSDMSGDEFEGKFLQRLIEIPKHLQGIPFYIDFKKAATISEIAVYSTLPTDNSIHVWEDNDSICDLMLFSTHADDEQLFFAGVLPLYATNKDCETQVVYFTDHSENVIRRHELLNGLWTVGVTRYPVISSFPDAYSTSYSGAVSNLKKSGFSETDAFGFQVEQIRRFKPLVILGHDLKGEYGHGQHILNATLLTQAVDAAADPKQFTDSAEKYGEYITPKLYLHLYNENEIILDLDTPIESIGKTPFELSKLGFACHKTQQGYWFNDWINGKNGEIIKASQIEKYSPCRFGLYHSTVGKDLLKNDLFENVTMRSLLPKPKPDTVPEPTPEPTPDSANPPINTNHITIAVLAAAIVGVIGIFIKLKRNNTSK